MTKTKPRVSRLHSQNLDDAAWRYDQAQIDADIEGLPRDTQVERLIADMTAAGVAPDVQIERIRSTFLARKAKSPEMT